MQWFNRTPQPREIAVTYESTNGENTYWNTQIESNPAYPEWAAWKSRAQPISGLQEPAFSSVIQGINSPILGGSRGPAVVYLLGQIAIKAGKPDFDFFPYAARANANHHMPSVASTPPQVFVNQILQAAGPEWQQYMYPSGQLAQITAEWQSRFNSGSFFGDVIGGLKNIAGVLALPAALLALPALLGQPTLYGAIAANVSGAAAIPPAVDPLPAAASQGESAATAVQSASSATSTLDVTDLSNLASGGAGSVDVGSIVSATPVDTAALSGSVDIATGATIPASISAAADATGTSLTSIAQDALKAVTGNPLGAAKYAAGLLATMGAGSAKPAPRVAVASQGGIGNTLIIGAAALLLLAVTKRK